jgi:polyferredoxin
MIEIDWRPTPRALRLWAVTLAAALAAMGSLFHFVDWGLFAAGKGMAPFLWGFGAFALVTAGTGTRIGLPAYWAWMAFVLVVGTVIGTVALGAVYFLVVTPLGVVSRLLGRDRLELRGARGRSMWRSIPNGGMHDPTRTF